jgi:hypothetical protein
VGCSDSSLAELGSHCSVPLPTTRRGGRGLGADCEVDGLVGSGCGEDQGGEKKRGSEARRNQDPVRIQLVVESQFS